MKRNRLKIAVVLFLLSIILNLIARSIDGFAEWYAITIYPFFVQTISRFMNIVPFSVSELLIYILLTVFLIKFLFAGWKFIRTEQRKTLTVRYIKDTIGFIFLSVSILLFICTLTCTINYSRKPFSAYSGLEIRKYSKAELLNLCGALIERANVLAGKIPLDSKGNCKLNPDSKKIAVESMKRLGEEYPILSGYYPNAKPVMTSGFLSYQLLAGVYSAFTIEAHYNKDMPEQNIPETMCHELSHLKGFMREDEAEFIAYLACIKSHDTVFQYSGVLTALTHSLNAFYKISTQDEYHKLYQQLSEQNLCALKYNKEFWEPYKGSVSNISDIASDLYLKANNQKDGLKSYGRMVDLLLAYEDKNQVD